MNDSRQPMLSAAELARKERGIPPRTQSVSDFAHPASASVNPPISTNLTRPARLSEVRPISEGEALPSTRNFAGCRRRSARTRSIPNKSGFRCISSRTTRGAFFPSRPSAVPAMPGRAGFPGPGRWRASPPPPSAQRRLPALAGTQQGRNGSRAERVPHLFPSSLPWEPPGGHPCFLKASLSSFQYHWTTPFHAPQPFPRHAGDSPPAPPP